MLAETARTTIEPRLRVAHARWTRITCPTPTINRTADPASSHGRYSDRTAPRLAVAAAAAMPSGKQHASVASALAAAATGATFSECFTTLCA